MKEKREKKSGALSKVQKLKKRLSISFGRLCKYTLSIFIIIVVTIIIILFGVMGSFGRLETSSSRQCDTISRCSHSAPPITRETVSWRKDAKEKFLLLALWTLLALKVKTVRGQPVSRAGDCSVVASFFAWCAKSNTTDDDVDVSRVEME